MKQFIIDFLIEGMRRHVAWNMLKHDYRLDSKYWIVFSLSVLLLVPGYAFAGTNFSVENVNISNSGAVNSFTPKIVSSNSDIYVIWEEGPFAASEIFFSKNSTDGGAQFDPPISLGSIKSLSDSHQIAESGDKVYVVWRDDKDISFRVSNNNGDTFEDEINGQLATLRSLGVTYQAPEGKLYVVVTTPSGSTPTYAVDAIPAVQLGILSDDPTWTSG